MQDHPIINALLWILALTFGIFVYLPVKIIWDLAKESG